MKKIFAVAIFVAMMIFATNAFAAYNAEFPNAELTVTLGETELVNGGTYEVMPGEIIHIKANSLCEQNFKYSCLNINSGFEEVSMYGKMGKVITTREYRQVATPNCFAEKSVEWDFVVPNAAINTERSIYVVAYLDEFDNNDMEVRLYGVNLVWKEQNDLCDGVTFTVANEIVAEGETAKFNKGDKLVFEFNRPIEAYGFYVFVNGNQTNETVKYTDGKIGIEAGLKKGVNEIKIETTAMSKSLEPMVISSQIFYVEK